MSEQTWKYCFTIPSAWTNPTENAGEEKKHQWGEGDTYYEYEFEPWNKWQNAGEEEMIVKTLSEVRLAFITEDCWYLENTHLIKACKQILFCLHSNPFFCICWSAKQKLRKPPLFFYVTGILKRRYSLHMVITLTCRFNGSQNYLFSLFHKNVTLNCFFYLFLCIYTCIFI